MQALLLKVFLTLTLAIFGSGCTGEKTAEAESTPSGSYQWENFHWDEDPVVVTLNVDEASDEWKEALYEAAHWWENDTRGLVEFQFTSFENADVLISSGDWERKVDGHDVAGYAEMQANTFGAFEYGEIGLNEKWSSDYENPQEYRISVACHELGHALGLGHAIGAESCMNDHVSYLYPGETDLLLLKRLYG